MGQEDEVAASESAPSLIPANASSAAFISVEFEVFGQVQGCYFTKYCKDICDQLGLGGWVKNSKKGTIIGKVQGEKKPLEELVLWLNRTGSPGCKIDHTELRNWEYLTRQDFRNFSIRF